MKVAKLLLVAILFTTAIGIGAPAFAENYGLKDSHGVWRDANYWHANHPEWVYRYHPEWAVERHEWWLADHRDHPGWFESPYWRRYPVWTYGDYDRNHVWRDAGWWRERDPGWFYAHHPGWAEPYPRWMREDHERHPEWFRGAYWNEHPRDWNHPDAEYRRDLERNVAYQEHNHFEGAPHPNGVGNFHAGPGAEHHDVVAGQYHAPAPSSSHSSVAAHPAGHSSGGGHSGKH